MTKSEQELWREREFSNAILDISGALIIVLDKTGKITLFNKACEKATRYSSEEVLGDHFSVLIPENEKREVRNQFDLLCAGKFPHQYENHWITKDGSKRLIMWSNTALTNDDGEIEFVICTGLDITERKRVEEALQASEQNYRQLVQNTTAIILRVDLEGRIIFINNRAQNFFGYSADEILGRHAVGTIIPERESTGRDLAAMVEEIITEPDRYHTNINENIKKSGERVWLEWTNNGIFDRDGKLREFLAVGIDVTDRKRVEDDLKKAMLLSSALNTISTALYSNLDTSEIMQILVEEGAKALQCQSAGISLYKNNTMSLSHVYGLPDSYVGMILRNDESPHGFLALRTGQPVIIRDASHDEGVNREHLKNHDIRSVLVMPLIVMNDPIGVLFLNNQNSPSPFSEAQVEFARQLAITAAIALKNSRLVEELNNFVAALEESERRLKLAITSADIGVYDINLITRERKWDDQVMKLWGLPRGYSLSEETFFAGIHPDDLQRIKAAYQLATDARGNGRYEDEYRVVGIEDGVERWVSVHGQVYFQDGRPIRILGTAIDITDKKNIELALRKSRDELEERIQERTRELSSMADELRESEEAYRLLVELNPVGVFRHVYDPVARKVKRLHCNEAQLRLLGYPCLDEYLKDNPAKTMRFKEDWNLYIGALIQEGKTVNLPVQMIQKDGNIIWVLLNATAREQGGELVIEGAMTDISSQKKVEERLRRARKQLRAMATEIVLADERSRQHIATDLHDTVVQTLGAAKLRTQLIQDQIPEKVQPIFTELQDMVSQSITQSRLIMSEMSPPVLYELGFVPALEWLTEQIQTQHNIQVDFKSNDRIKPLVHEMQVLLFQATRELLMNVVKHARAENVIVKISFPGEKIRIEVMDDGQGFDKRQAFRSDIHSGGFGLFSIRERLRHFGGNLSIRSKNGKGTVVVMTIPLTISQ